MRVVTMSRIFLALFVIVYFLSIFVAFSQETESAPKSMQQTEETKRVSDQSTQKDNREKFLILFGVGTGTFNFTSTDGERGSHDTLVVTGDPVTSGGNDEIDTARLIHYWIEAYYTYFGIGLRYITIYDSNTRQMHVVFDDPIETDTYSDGDAYVGQRIEVISTLLTGQFWYPIKDDNSIHLGVMVGYGTTEYSSEYYWAAENSGEIDESNKFSKTYKTSGSTLLFGSFIDLTHDFLGGRIGIEYLNTNLDDFKGTRKGTSDAEADASGYLYYLDLTVRW